MDEKQGELKGLQSLVEKFAPTAETLAKSLLWSGEIVHIVDRALGIKPLPEARAQRIETALIKKGFEKETSHQLAEAYSELDLGKAQLRDEAAEYLSALGKGLFRGIFSRKGVTATGTDFVPLPIIPVWSFGDLMGASRAIYEINTAGVKQEGVLKLLIALVPGIPTGMSHMALERFFEAIYIESVLENK
ncbi:MAG: hypothetical protein AAB768_02695 [Patescibacteria group bacterium]|mgnify:CR=1 FL=1